MELVFTLPILANWLLHTTFTIKIIFQMKKANHSIRNIGKQTGMSRNTVRDYLRRLQDSGLGYEVAI